jgi:hypothetical protein
MNREDLAAQILTSVLTGYGNSIMNANPTAYAKRALQFADALKAEVAAPKKAQARKRVLDKWFDEAATNGKPDLRVGLY